MRWLAIAIGVGCSWTATFARADDVPAVVAPAPRGPRVSVGVSAGVASNAGVGAIAEPVRPAGGGPIVYVPVKDRPLSANAGVALNLAARLGTRRWRAGVLADLVLCPPQAGHAMLVDLRPMLAIDANLRLEDDARLWLGIAAGPSFRNLEALVTGFSTFVSLDVAVPISSRFAFDTIVRGGFDEALTATTSHPDPIGEFAVGLSWN